MEQIRIIKEMRENDKRNGRTGKSVRCRYMVWENVPGALSCNGGRDFAAVLEETIRVAEPEAPDVDVPEHGWPNWGGYREMDGRWSVAWRIMDAQYWGVPQRRRRIALVADFGGDSAHKILFKPDSMCGCSPQSGEAQQGAPADTENGAGASSGDSVTAYGISGYYSNAMLSDNPHSGVYKAETSRTLDLNGGNPCCNQGGIAVVQAKCYDARGNGDGKTAPTMTGDHENRITDYTTVMVCPDVAHTLRAKANCAYAEDKETYVVSTDVLTQYGDKAGTITQRFDSSPCAERGQNILCVATGQANAEIVEDGSPTLNCAHEQPYIAAVDCRNATENANVNGTLQAKSNGGTSYNLQNTVRTGYIVRRLTPVECERLQNFPDGWTDIGEWADDKGRMRKTTDSNRYKALGNSIALPQWRFVLGQIARRLPEGATLGSLFDGISGFSLVWAEINGLKSVRWASEIEPFSIAVCKKHFGDEETGEEGDFYEAILGRNKEKDV